MSSGIYKWTNNITNSIYIGKSKNLNKRKKQFLNFKYTYASEKLEKERKKYPSITYWKYEILEMCPINDLDYKEKYYIKEHLKLNVNLLNVIHNKQIKIEIKCVKDLIDFLSNLYPSHKEIFQQHHQDFIILDDSVAFTLPNKKENESILKELKYKYFEEWEDLQKFCITLDLHNYNISEDEKFMGGYTVEENLKLFEEYLDGE